MKVVGLLVLHTGHLYPPGNIPGTHYGPGVDSACNRNEYQEYFVGVKAAGA